MSYAIYLNELRMPVNPETFKEDMDRSLKEYDILETGKVVVPESRGLRTFEFESIFTAERHSFCHAWKEPSVYLKFIQEHFKKKEAIDLVVSNGTSYGLSLKVMITTFSCEEVQAGNYEYSIKLKEYAKSEVRATDIPAIQRPRPVIQPQEVVVPVPATASVYDTIQSGEKVQPKGSKFLITLPSKKPVKNPVATQGPIYSTVYPPNSWQGAMDLNKQTVNKSSSTIIQGSIGMFYTQYASNSASVNGAYAQIK